MKDDQQRHQGEVRPDRHRAEAQRRPRQEAGRGPEPRDRRLRRGPPLRAREADGRHRRRSARPSTGSRSTTRAPRTPCTRSSRSSRPTPAVIGKDRRLLIVLVTDESGDDGDFVEEAHQAVVSLKVPVYVIGRQSLFGYGTAHLRYVDPVTKDVYWPSIHRGPESADVETLQWDGLHGRWEEQPSGFAPYELARLAKDTGGIYFLLPSEENMRVHQREKLYSINDAEGIRPRLRGPHGLRRPPGQVGVPPDPPRDHHGDPELPLPRPLPGHSRPDDPGRQRGDRGRPPSGSTSCRPSRSGSRRSRSSATASPTSGGRRTTT